MLKGLQETDVRQFLSLLDSNTERAGEMYVALRQRLEKFFEWRDRENTEELTDIVFDRVTKKIIEGEEIQNAEAYCVSVAKFVLLENRREVLRIKELDENTAEPNPDPDETDEERELSERRLKCLDECLEELPVEKRSLIVSYFDTDEDTMISTRKRLAETIGTNLNTLRIRVSRLKSKLETCTKECCEEMK